MTGITWIAVCLLSIGYIQNIRKKPSAWIYWITCSCIWVIYSIATFQYSLLANNLICLAFCSIGCYTWFKQKALKTEFVKNIGVKKSQELIDWIKSND